MLRSRRDPALVCASVLASLLFACANDEPIGEQDEQGGGGCKGLCEVSGFSGGEETDFANGLVECQCTGTGGEVLKSSCENYCTTFRVPAEKALLSAEPGALADKCACDGT